MKIVRNLFRLFGHIDIIRFSVRDRIIRWYHNPDTAKSEEFIVSFYGQTYHGNFNTFIDWSVYYYGAYDKEELRLLKEILDPIAEPVVFDVGANVGHHTLYGARHSKQVYAFEPFEMVAAAIDRKIHDNNITNVALCKFGLGEENSRQDYYPPCTTNTATGSFLSGNAENTTATPIRLEIRRGDDFVKQQGIRRLDFIKMDIEGFEPFALRGLQQTLSACRPIIFFEYNQLYMKSYAPESIKALFPPAYAFFKYDADGAVLKYFRKPFYQLRPLADGWGYGNILAVPKEYLEKIRSLEPTPAIQHRLRK